MQYTFIISLVVIYLIVLYAIKVQIPDSESLVQLLTLWYATYGYPLIFLAAFLEGTFVISFYVPGSTAVLLGAAISKTGVIQFPWVVFFATLGLVLSYCVNYALGKHGWYHALSRMGLEKGLHEASEKLHTHKKKTFFLGYFHPGSASFISTAAGVSNVPFKEFLFYTVCSQIIWSLLWGSLAYIIGMTLVELFIKYFTYVVIVLIAIWLVKRYLYRRKHMNLPIL